MDLGPVEAIADDGDGRSVEVLDLSRPEHLEAIRRADMLALDLESDNFHRYFEKTCLLQLATSEADWFVDPLSSGLPDALAEELGRTDRPVVMHAAENDVRAIARDFGVRLGRIFDTALAARILGYPGLGLKALLEGELDVTVDKGEQRSDWSRRPLTEEQLRYARQDVRWLTQLSSVLGARLDDTGRRAWHDDECDRLRHLEPVPKRFDADGWRKVKAAKGLGPRGRSVMAKLWHWRETRASEVDEPAVRIAYPEQLARIARAAEEKGAAVLEELGSMRGLPSRLDRAALREAIGAGLEADDPGAKAPPGSREGKTPLDEAGKARRDGLRGLRDRRAKELGIDPGFLLANKVVERVARVAPSTREALDSVPGLHGWRARLLGQEILDVICT